ncbi:tripartite motif-containing protein 29-like [Etheostoma cragini]|uniref:tripartite motif-containing protein 29-like n=1 Tax=Etheostoma cragini TaxID=417921 RepID=UPI00155E92BD|nr:tripartite motif-containing protein 29-like [Etheostoma cragini]
MTTVDLLNTLEDLKEEEFMKFKWHLHQDVLEGFQPIKVSKLENAERQDTVDVMVSTHQLEGALTVAKKVLEMMNRNDLVQSLPDTGSGPQVCVDLAAASNVPEEEPSAQQKASSSSSEQQVSKPGEVPCDVCTGTKLKALKSCLVCLASYCETHLEPHLTTSGLKSHQLIDPGENLEGRMCTKHDKPLELFCKTDQTCVCMLCTVLDHKTHDVVPLKEEYKGKKAELGKTEAEIQQMIQKRRLKVQEIKHSVELSEEAADRELAEGVQVFTSLKESVERGLNELINTIKEKQKTTEKQAEAFITELEQEISELMKRSTEVEQLSRSEDHLHLLQRVQSLNTNHPPPTKDWTEVSVRPSSYEGTTWEYQGWPP